MPRRAADANSRRFFDEFAKVRVSRFRATGVIDPAKSQAIIPFPDGTSKLIGTQHVRFPCGGGYSYFVCPKCARRAQNIYLIEQSPLCWRCCDAMNIKHRCNYGFGREERRQTQNKYLDQQIATLETKTPLRLKPRPKAHRGRLAILSSSRSLTHKVRHNLVKLRLNWLASQQTSQGQGLLHAYQPLAETKQLIDTQELWSASTPEALQRALDKAQSTILKALDSPDFHTRLAAARLIFRSRQGRERGF